MKKNRFWQFFLKYTGIFAVSALLIFGIFVVNGKTLIWNGDGWDQHYKALLYYSRWLRQAARQVLVDHNFHIPTYSFSIGYGSDILTTLHYYVIGDPICLLAVVVPIRYMKYFYSGAIIFRYYLSGLSFSCFCRYLRKRDEQVNASDIAILAGSMVYVFCGYALYAGVRHPYFLNPMIYFPLVLMGSEKLFRKEKPFLFVGSVFLSAISNFYFFYMIVILTVMYVVWRLVFETPRRNIKQAVLLLGAHGIYGILGTGLSAILLLPVIRTFLRSGRIEESASVSLSYLVGDYESSLGGFVSPATGGHDWTFMGYGAVAVLCVCLLWTQRGQIRRKIAFLVLTIMTLLPIAGSFMNGGSYAANRWIWAYSFLIAFCVTVEWEKLLHMTEKQKRWVFLVQSLFFLLCLLLQKSRTIDSMASAAIGFLILCVLFFDTEKAKKWNPHREKAVLLCVTASMILNAFFLYSPRHGGYANQFMDSRGLEAKMTYSEAAALNNLESSGDFYRYAADRGLYNGTLYSGLHSTQYYWSLENGAISRFMEEMALSDSIMFQNYQIPDGRTFLSALANVKYYVQEEQPVYNYSLVGKVPAYGSEEEYLQANSPAYDVGDGLTEEERACVQEQINSYTIWANENALPFGYTYDSYISAEDYQKMNLLEKQEAMLQGCVIEGDNASTQQGSQASLAFTGESVEYDVKLDEGITEEDGLYRVTKAGAAITLSFQGLPNAETYLMVDELFFQGMSPREQYSDLEWELLSESEKNEVKRSEKYYNEPTTLAMAVAGYSPKNAPVYRWLTYYTPRYTWYSGRNQFCVNLGYAEEQKTSIKLVFPEAGEYSFGDLEVLCQPMNSYESQVAALAEEHLENVDFHDQNGAFATSQVTGTIALTSPKYVLLTIPYEEGWSVTVDGEVRELLQANTMFSAVYVEEGEHDIALTYETPGLKLGCAVSGGSVILLICFILVGTRSRRKKTKTMI